ncbi:MAG: DUF488 domain-containing protein [Archaeoglobaceae archaeon]|nr:DUF488 domain-containing protein [Archaeoglobaceae archaeon]
MREIYTIGHSNLDFTTFTNLLLENAIEVVVDIRRFPKSRFEHFNAEYLKQKLSEVGIEYMNADKLGGFRKKIFKVSPNKAIKSEGFRNYADFMLTEEFEKEIKKLIELAERRRVALMCAEKFFWRCHRKFLSDYLTFHGFRVYHIIGERLILHKLSEIARIEGGKLIYDIEKE